MERSGRERATISIVVQSARPKPLPAQFAGKRRQHPRHRRLHGKPPEIGELGTAAVMGGGVGTAVGLSHCSRP